MPAPAEWNELCELVAGKKFEEAAALLKQKPYVRSIVNGIGETVLHYQAIENDLEGVSWLWSQGFDINTRNEFGRPVVFEVAQLDYRGMLQWFVSKGADLKCQDRDGNNIKQYVLEYGLEDVAEFLKSLGV